MADMELEGPLRWFGVGWGEILSVFVLMVVETDTTLGLRPVGSLYVDSWLVSSSLESLSRSSESSCCDNAGESTSSLSSMYEGTGEAEMEVVTAVLSEVTALWAACERAVMMAGPGKMWALMMLAQRTICKGPAVNCFCTVPGRDCQWVVAAG